MGPRVPNVNPPTHTPTGPPPQPQPGTHLRPPLSSFSSITGDPRGTYKNFIHFKNHFMHFKNHFNSLAHCANLGDAVLPSAGPPFLISGPASLSITQPACSKMGTSVPSAPVLGKCHAVLAWKRPIPLDPVEGRPCLLLARPLGAGISLLTAWSRQPATPG